MGESCAYAVSVCLLSQKTVSKVPLKIPKQEELEEEEPEKEELDWWSKYYASLEELEKKVIIELTSHTWNADIEGPVVSYRKQSQTGNSHDRLAKSHDSHLQDNCLLIQSY